MQEIEIVFFLRLKTLARWISMNESSHYRNGSKKTEVEDQIEKKTECKV